MEIQIPKSSDFIKPSDNLQDDITDIGLPKSSLNSVLKDFLSKNKFRGDKNIIPMLDSISRHYVTYVSNLGNKICLESGKKTLNIEHVIEALKQMKFKKHIDLLIKDNPNGTNESEKIKQLTKNLNEEENKIENNNIKKLINKKKKRGSRKKHVFEDENEKETIKRMQEQMYEEAMQDFSLKQQNSMPELQMSNTLNSLNNINNEFNIGQKDNNSVKPQNLEDYGKQLFFNKAEENDINFD